MTVLLVGKFRRFNSLSEFLRLFFAFFKKFVTTIWRHAHFTSAFYLFNIDRVVSFLRPDEASFHSCANILVTRVLPGVMTKDPVQLKSPQV